MNNGKIYYDIPLLTQTGSSNCVQTSVAMLLSYYGQIFTPEVIQTKIPVRFDSQGKPFGTLLMDIATWIKSIGLGVALDCFDCEIIDRSWKNIPANEIIKKLKLLKASDRQTVIPIEICNSMIDSYIKMLESKVTFHISELDRNYLWRLIKNGPFLPIVSYNYLYYAPRDKYDVNFKKYSPDDIEGKTTSHAVIAVGMDDEKIYINDPDETRGGQNSFSIDHFIVSIAIAQNKANNWILYLDK